ncbi:MAG: OmpA family protein [Syntrophorhabdaceae bacterium]|nr:OmpA family protein [Syntrophorhabdaceae bacterium]
MKTLIIVVAVAGILIAGCATKTQTGGAVGAGVGAAVGAGAGQAIGRDTSSTLIGAGIGAIVGGLTGAAIGNYMDKQEQSMRQAVANSEAATVRREQEIIQGARQQSVDVLTVTFKSDYLFAVNSSTLLPGAQSELQRVATVIRQYPETNIQIAGHTDSTGSEDYNRRLSEQRAESVKTALIGMGVNPSRLTTLGYGESRPVASNNTEGGRQQNRRVEVRIVPQTA